MNDTVETPKLTLADDLTGLVGPTRIAELVAEYQGRETPYSDQSVRNWVKKGYLKPAGSNKRGKLYNPAHVPAIAQNLPSPKHGGARRNAGRKKQVESTDNAPLTKEMKKAAEARDAAEAFLERIKNHEEPPPDEAVHVSELLGFTRQELRAILAMYGVREHSISPAKVDLLNKLLDLKFKDQRLEKENGELVEKSAMIDAIKDTHRPVVEMLSQLPATLLSELNPWVWLNQAAVNAVMSRVNAALSELGLDQSNETVRAMLDTLRADISRPPSLDATLRALIDRTVDHARRTLVDDMRPPEKDQDQ